MKDVYVILRANLPSRRSGFSPQTFDLERGLESAEPVASAGLSADVDEIDRRRVAALRREPQVLGVAPAMPMNLITPMDEGPAAPGGPDVAWGVTAVGAASSPQTGEGIVVAVLDTGINRAHSAFAGVDITEKDFTGDGNGDTNGHGTHCAGTIFGRDTNGVRIGIARGVGRVLIGKVIGRTGGASPAIVNAMLWAAQNGAHIVSMSLGIDFPGYQAALQQREKYPPALATSLALEGYRANVQLFEKFAAYLRTLSAFGQPTILVAAAGNESRRDEDAKYEIAVSPPAVADGFISVAALGESAGGLTVAPFSNTGASVSAPGVAVVSAGVAGGLISKSGTSMATPHVAGVAALWAERLANRAMLTAARLTADVTSHTITTALKPGFDVADVGNGLVQAPQ